MRLGEVISAVGVGRIAAGVIIVIALAAVGARAAGWTDDFLVEGATAGLASGSAVEAESSTIATDTGTPGPATPGQESAISVVVHVAGAVLRPGVYTLAGTPRVVDAVQAAGGPSIEADESAVNFAALLTDSAQVYIPTRDQVAKGWSQGVAGGGSGTALGSTPGFGSGSGGSLAGGPVNINTAGVAELDALPGIGQVTAGKIVADRTANGPFRSLDDLARISGIGDAKIGALEGLAVAR